MRLTNTLLRKGKLPPNPKKIPFKEMFPVQLKNEVSGAGQKSAGTIRFNNSFNYKL